MATQPKIKLDPQAAMNRHFARSAATAQDRFALAAETITRIPTGLSPEQPVADTTPAVSQATLTTQKPVHHSAQEAFDISKCVPGAVISVPFHLIDLNPVGPRQIYRSEEIDKIAQTLVDGQDDAAHGFVRGERVVLIDGGTRYRSAKISGVGFCLLYTSPSPRD